MRQLLTTTRQIGEILRARRKARRLSQTQLSAKLDISQERLSRLEKDPAGMTLQRLLSITNLLGFDLVIEDRPPKTASKAEW